MTDISESALMTKVHSQMDALGINEAELVRRTGILQQSVNNFLNAKVIVPKQWKAIAQVLEIEEDEMLALMQTAGSSNNMTLKTVKVIKSQSKSVDEVMASAKWQLSLALGVHVDKIDLRFTVTY